MGFEYKLDESITDKYIIFSAFHFLEDSDTNAEHTNQVQKLLEERNIPFRKVYGKYREEFEYSFIVNHDHIQLIRSLASKYSQECFLIVSEPSKADYRVVAKYYLSGEVEMLGNLKKVKREIALSTNNYIYDYELDEYFITDLSLYDNITYNQNIVYQ